MPDQFGKAKLKRNQWIKNLIPGLKIRSLTSADAPELSYLELAIFSSPWSENALRGCLELSTVEGWGALDGDKVIAYLLGQFVSDESHLLNVGVLPEHRRKGIGRLLLDLFLTRCEEKEANTCYLEVRAGNLAAQKLYFQYGFMPVYVRKKYYPNGEDALILVKHFPDSIQST
ncbi:MAG: ribosomal protein S18-alanine N-acetyltransferase [bacterium]|nr:ribosomal protein S18-alanine N-acetyltransferase [bacterium]